MSDDIIASLDAFSPLVSGGYEVPAAGVVMHNAARALEEKKKQIAELEAKIKRLSGKKLIRTDVTRERIYNAISAWTNAPETVCSCTTEAIVRIVNDHFEG